MEVKSGAIRRDAHGWWAGGVPLPRSPFEQAADSRYSLVKKLLELPAWDPSIHPIAGDAVALPDVDLDSAGSRAGMLGPDVAADLILDQRLMTGGEAGAAALRTWVIRALELFGRDSGALQPPGVAGVRLLVDLLTEPIELRPDQSISTGCRRTASSRISGRSGSIQRSRRRSPSTAEDPIKLDWTPAYRRRKAALRNDEVRRSIELAEVRGLARPLDPIASVALPGKQRRAVQLTGAARRDRR